MAASAAMPPRARSSPAVVEGKRTGRQALLAQARRELLTHGWPRLQASLIVAGAGAAGFLTSVALLAASVDAMGWRYALAAVTGYAAFVGLVGIWVRWHRRSQAHGGGDLPLDVLLDRPLPRGTTTVTHALFEGGGSGGAGGGASFDGPVLQAAYATPSGPSGAVDAASAGGSWLGGLLDGEDAAFLLLAVACVGAGALAIGYVVYAAPLLLAEVALDAALLGALYCRLRRDDARHWSRGLVRGTWVPALIVVLSAAGAGYFLQRAVPEARSIGGVVAALTSAPDTAGRRSPLAEGQEPLAAQVSDQPSR